MRKMCRRICAFCKIFTFHLEPATPMACLADKSQLILCVLSRFDDTPTSSELAAKNTVNNQHIVRCFPNRRENCWVLTGVVPGVILVQLPLTWGSFITRQNGVVIWIVRGENTSLWAVCRNTFFAISNAPHGVRCRKTMIAALKTEIKIKPGRAPKWWSQLVMRFRLWFDNRKIKLENIQSMPKQGRRRQRKKRVKVKPTWDVATQRWPCEMGALATAIASSSLCTVAILVEVAMCAWDDADHLG